MRKSYIFARRITSGRSGYPIAWDGVSDFSAWYAKNISATSTKGILKLFVTHDDDRTAGQLNGLIVEVEGKAGKDIGGARGLNVSVYLPSNTPATKAAVYGLHVEAQGGGPTLSSDFFTGYFYHAPSVAPGGSSGVLRLESNVGADNRNKAWIHFVGPYGEAAMDFGPLSTCTAWSYNDTTKHNNLAGWLKVRVVTDIRYIPMYSS